MTGGKKRGNTQAATATKPAATEREFRPNNGGINRSHPPLLALQNAGLEIEGKGF